MLQVVEASRVPVTVVDVSRVLVAVVEVWLPTQARLPVAVVEAALLTQARVPVVVEVVDLISYQMMTALRGSEHRHHRAVGSEEVSFDVVQLSLASLIVFVFLCHALDVRVSLTIPSLEKREFL